MKKIVVSAAVLAVLTGGMTTAVSFATMVPASACPASDKSEDLARQLPQVNHGDKGKHVLALQLALRQEGYTYLKGTGTYAAETLRAVKDFQRKHHIRASGIVGSKTWQALVGRKSTNFTGGQMHVVPVFSFQPGERNRHKFSELYSLLTRIDPYLDQLNGYSGPSDVYGPELQKMVRDFQKRAGIKASGIVGPKTVSAMNEAVSVAGRWGC